MSWGNYNQGQSPYGDPYGRSSGSEPTGYVTSDPYAPTGQGYGQSYGQEYNQGYGQPSYQMGHSPYQYRYDGGHPAWPTVGFTDAIKLYFRNYAVFYGRASRSEYWWVFLAQAIVWSVLSIGFFLTIIVDPTATDPPAAFWALLSVASVVGLGTIVPTISVQVRRLHDAGYSGFFALLNAVPYLNYIGSIVLIVLCAQRTNQQGVKYDNPNGSQPAVP